MSKEFRAWRANPAGPVTPRRGDLFALEHRSGAFAFGRVVLHEVSLGGTAPVRLVTFSIHTSADARPPVCWSPPNLAIPPLLLADEGWRKGVARPLENLGLLPQEDLGRVTFTDAAGTFVDAAGERMGWAQGLLVPFALETWETALARLAKVLSGAQARDPRLGPGADPTGPRLP